MSVPRARSLGRYELLVELARGGMAELFLGRLHGAGGFAKLVAIKRILPHLAEDRQFHEMFLNEGRIAAQLSHPNVCQVFELGEADGELFLVMEYLDGVAWEHLIARAPRDAALALAAGVLGQAAEGLHYAHTLRDPRGQPTPVVHRDVSPQNLFVTVDGVCKVLDFGVSKMTTEGPRTRSGVIKGKLPYMAPEQIRGEPVDARADVFSLGVCAWEALTGARLFDRPTDFQIWKAITEDDVPPIASRWPACPPLVESVVRRALAREPDHRQASARGFANELRNAAGGEATAGAIAEAVRGLCGDRLAAAAGWIAAAVASPGGPPASAAAAAAPAPAPAAGGMQLRGASIAVRRDGPEAGAAADDAAPTRDFAQARVTDGSGTPAPAGPPPAPGRRPGLRESRARRRSHLVTALLTGTVAALITAVVVVALTRGDGPRPPAPEPVVAAPPDASALDPAFEALGRIGDLQRNLTRLREQLAPLQGGEAAGATGPAEDPGAGGGAPDEAPAASEPEEAAGSGAYAVDSRPRATIYDGARRLGTTPLRVPLPAGKHVIRAVLPDGRERSFAIEIEPGKETRSSKLAW